MKYIPLLIAFAEVVKPIYADFQQAIAEGKSSDPVTLKLQKILTDIEDALAKASTAL